MIEPAAEAEMFVAIIDSISILQIRFQVQQLRSVGWNFGVIDVGNCGLCYREGPFSA